MFKLRFLCLKQLTVCPVSLRDDLHWEVYQEKNKLEIKKTNIEHSIIHLESQRLIDCTYFNAKMTKKIFKLEDEIATCLFDQWYPVTEEEEIWREYFFCLYDFMVSEKVQIDMSNIKLISEYSIQIYDTLEKPRIYQGAHVHLMNSKFSELYTFFKNIEIPNIPQKANESLKKNIEIVKQLTKQNAQICQIKKNIDFYDELLSSSLCSFK